jgi:hypothetical protein
VAALPSLAAFPWFLAMPGAVLLLLGATALFWPAAWPRLRWLVLATGLLLLVGPLALGLVDAGNAGGRMITAFRTVETQANVTALQNDFSSITIGQSALETELPVKVIARMPAVAELDRRWVTILGDLTPALGTLSDDVADYRAVTALPPFSAFPWLFFIPGALAILVALMAGAGTPRMRLPARTFPAKTRFEARSTS